MSQGLDNDHIDLTPDNGTPGCRVTVKAQLKVIRRSVAEAAPAIRLQV
jgi:hypothetical protein